MKSVLAIHGGHPVIDSPLPSINSIGPEERDAALAVLDSGVLSQFLASWGPDFLGGPRVRGFENAWRKFFGVEHAVSVNSATSGLYAAVGAAGIEPGDEVIVSPYTMAASATAAIVYGAVPVFADIDPDTYCISPATISRCLTERTRGIIVVDIFGHPVDIRPILDLARPRGITVIEDAAQAPGAHRSGRWAGTDADIGVFSLNYHKTIQTGEGGVVVTRRDDLAERLQLIRNHAEVVVRAKGTTNVANLVGFNFRMTEIEAAIGTAQLAKLEGLAAARHSNGALLATLLRDSRLVGAPKVEPGVRHGFYIFVLRYKGASLGVSRDSFVAAIRAEGVPATAGYVRPLYLEPMYQQRVAFGLKGYPFVQDGRSSSVSYAPGICPETERMHFSEAVCLHVCQAGMTAEHISRVAEAINKVEEGIGQLRELATAVTR